MRGEARVNNVTIQDFLDNDSVRLHGSTEQSRKFNGFIEHGGKLCSERNGKDARQEFREGFDSGASTHMTGNLNMFNTIERVKCSVPVQLPDNTIKIVDSMGTIELTSDMALHDFLYISSFKHNLLSVSKLSRSANIIFKFYPKFCLLQDFKTLKVLGVAKEEKGLYILNADSFSIHVVRQFMQFTDFFENKEPMVHPVNKVVEDKDNVWHHRLGHAPYYVIKDIPMFDTLQINENVRCFV
ncbi:hypothetical protein LIER_21911 [Lithospermum erythrorhizon]|uniref:Retrovirus-related Pol polyprotein from transposon TNT 1-94-like beta-barrel domain-containing protein n=1 Tax=Lithospermum erythrorhizon TaxID=34254 RepID=A0AAV3QUE1_LITER